MRKLGQFRTIFGNFQILGHFRILGRSGSPGPHSEPLSRLHCQDKLPN